MEVIPFSLSTYSRGVALSAAAVLYLVHHLGHDIEVAVEQMKKTSFPACRFDIEKITGEKQYTLIDDTFNVQPASFIDSVWTFGAMKANGRKVAILGSIIAYDLTDINKYYEFVDLINEYNFDVVILIGNIGIISDKLKNVARVYNDKMEANEKIDEIIGFLESGDSILVKCTVNCIADDGKEFTVPNMAKRIKERLNKEEKNKGTFREYKVWLN